MPPCDRLLHAVTMPAAIGTKRFLLIGVASLLHAKAIGTPLSGDWCEDAAEEGQIVRREARNVRVFTLRKRTATPKGKGPRGPV